MAMTVTRTILMIALAACASAVERDDTYDARAAFRQPAPSYSFEQKKGYGYGLGYRGYYWR